MNQLSRRAWLKGLAAITGGAIGTRVAGSAFIAPAIAAPTKSAVVSIFFEGGFNALFASADSFAAKGSFGVTATNAKSVGNGLVVDASTIGALGDWALGHMAAIGNRHGATDHISAQRNNFLDGARSYAVQLAGAIGGDAAFKAVALGGLPVPGPSAAEAGVSHQLLRSMDDVSTALGVGPADPARPMRKGAATALAGAQKMSARAIGANPRSLSFVKDAYETDIGSLNKAPLAIDVAKVTQAYGVRNGGLDSIASKLAAAELMLRSGTNVVTMGSDGWDTHGDRTGMTVRRRMTAEVIPALKTFLARLRSESELTGLNVSVILHGDFARSLPSSDHATALSALVIGPNVKVGTTGRVSAEVTLPPATGASREMWSYLAALSKVKENPFGQNTHALILG